MQTRYIEKYEKENAREFLILLLWLVYLFSRCLICTDISSNDDDYTCEFNEWSYFKSLEFDECCKY